MNTIAISDLQKSPKNALESAPFSYILANNKKRGMILNAKMADFLEEKGWLEEYEDEMLLQNFADQTQEAQKIIETGDYSDTTNFEDL